MPSDKEFLAKYDFDKEVPYDGRNPDWLDEEFGLLHQRLDTFVHNQSGRSFTLKEFTEYTGIGRKVGLNYLRSRSDVVPTLKGKDGRVERYMSLAEPLESTIEGALEVIQLEMRHRDWLGRQARGDFVWTQTRSPKKRKRAVRLW